MDLLYVSLANAMGLGLSLKKSFAFCAHSKKGKERFLQSSARLCLHILQEKAFFFEKVQNRFIDKQPLAKKKSSRIKERKTFRETLIKCLFAL